MIPTLSFSDLSHFLSDFEKLETLATLHAIKMYGDRFYCVIC